jgi:antitoxin YefM
VPKLAPPGHHIRLLASDHDDHIVIEIVARNGGNAVLMSADDYESLQETLYLFSTRANAVHILRGLAEAREGSAQPTELETLAARFNVQAEE